MMSSLLPVIVFAIGVLVVSGLYALLGSDWAQQRWNSDERRDQ